MNDSSTSKIVKRIEDALKAAADAITQLGAGAVAVEFKSGDDPVTVADRTANRVLREALLQNGEGWLSEESPDDLERLKKNRVWVVDPLDGTREFVAGTPEWSISVGLVENGRAVAGGVYNPSTGEMFLSTSGQGVTLNGNIVRPTGCAELADAVVLASRAEVKRGEWIRFADAPFRVRPVGSVAYKLALVAAGLADATWTFNPKHEWDVAGGVALIENAGGVVRTLDGLTFRFNNQLTLLPGLVACAPHLRNVIEAWFNESAQMSAILSKE